MSSSTSSTATTTTSTTTTTTTTSGFQTGVQYGFFFDQDRCYNCHACSIACRDWNNIPPGPVKWMKVFRWEIGAFPNVQLRSLAMPCYHCENPPCVAAANGAMYKEPSFGAVLIDPALATSANLKAAYDACPYGSICFDSDAPNSTASKCTMCIDRLEQGLKPICVMSCPTRAFEFDTLANLQKKYGSIMDLDGLPKSSIAGPSVVFNPAQTRTPLIPYDATRALQLMANRGSLPPVYSSPSDVTGNLSGVAFNKLVLKPGSTEGVLNQTKNDWG